MSMVGWQHESDAVEEALQDLADEWGDEDALEEWGDEASFDEWDDEGFFRRFGQRVRALGQRARRWLTGAIASVLIRPDPKRLPGPRQPSPVIAPAPPRTPPPAPWRPAPPRVPAGPPTNGSPPLRWDPRWFPPARRRRGDVNFEADEADALLQHLGHAAAAAESEEEAEAFAGAMIPLAAGLVPRAAPALLHHAPALIRTVAAATRALRQSGRTRPLVQILPTAVRRTAVALARQTGGARAVTPHQAARTLAAQTTGLLRRPGQSLHALRRAVRVDRHYHEEYGEE